MQSMPLFDQRKSGPPSRDEIQDEMIYRIEALRKKGRKSAAIQAATGVGKTFLAAKWIKFSRHRKARFLFLCHSKLLINQAAAEFRKAGINFAVEQGERRAGDGMSLFGGIECVIGSKDSLQDKRLEGWNPKRFTDIIGDEIHLAESESWKNVLNHFDVEFLLGLSATLFRTDGKPLYGTEGSLFGTGGVRSPYDLEGLPPFDSNGRPTKVHEAVAFKYPLPAAIKNGHLADMVAVPVGVEVDLKNIRTTVRNGIKDFNQSQLEVRISQALNPLVSETIRHMDRIGIKKLIFFTPQIKSADMASQLFNDKGIMATAVWANTKDYPLPEATKQSRIDSFMAGRYRVICSADLLTVGANFPDVDGIGMARPTKSLGLALQMVGRATRWLPEKRVCYILGFEWQGADDIISTIDILTEDEPDPLVRKAMKRIARDKPETPGMDLLELARKEADDEAAMLAKLALRRAKAINMNDKRAGKRRYREFRLFNVGEIVGVNVEADRVSAKQDPATQAQLEVLRDIGLGKVTGLDRSSAQRIIDQEMDRGFRKKAEVDLVRKMMAKGLDGETARAMTRNDAEEWLRKRDRPSRKMQGWLRHRGYTTEQIKGMTAAEARTIRSSSARARP